MSFKITLHASYLQLQDPYSKCFKSLVSFLHFAVLLGVHAKVLVEGGFGDGLCEWRPGAALCSTQQTPASSTTHPLQDAAEPISQPGGISTKTYLRKGKNMERRKTGEPKGRAMPEQKEMLHSKGTVAHR